MDSSGSLSKSQPARAKPQANWMKRARAAGAHAAKGACSALGAGAISLLIWWIENK